MALGEMSAPAHIPVLLGESIQALAVQPGGRYVDCTVGGGGHAAAILEHSSPGGQLLGIDADPEAIAIARARLEAYGDSVLLVNDNFVNLEAICIKHDFLPLHGILFDLGLSSLQLESCRRGFSFRCGAALDMRFSPSQEVTAADIVNTSSEAELAQILRRYGEETSSHRIARRIVRERPLRTALELAETVERAARLRRGKLHPATKTFQALRIAVNHELEYLEAALKQAVSLLGFEGRLAVISYHSLEDRIVKSFFRQEARDCICPPSIPGCVCQHTASLRPVGRGVVTPAAAEVKANPRSRSARLRVAERLISREEWRENTDRLNFLAESGRASGRRRPVLLKKSYGFFSMS